MKKHILVFLALCMVLAAAGMAGAAGRAAPEKKVETQAADKSDRKAETKAAEAKAGTGESEGAKILVMDLTMGDPEDSEMGILGIAFKNYVANASKGRIEVDLAYGGGLDADETYQFHRVQTGKLEMAFGGVGNLAPMVKGLGVVTLPYLFPDIEAVVRGTTGKAAELLQSYAEKAGLRILAWTYYGYRFFSNSKRPIKTMEDMKGMRMRVPQSLVMIKAYRAFGAIPMPLAWPMTRSALKNGLVDGQCYDYAGFRSMKFQDAGQRYITETHYIYNLQPLVMNNKFFKSLPEADQKILLDAGKHIQELSLQYQKEMNAMAKRALIADGVHVNAIEDESAWKNVAIEKVWPQAADSMGGDKAINEYLEACGLPLWKPEEAAAK